MIISKQHMEANLDQHKMLVIFTKTDGSTRVMHCTRNKDLIPKEHHHAILPDTGGRNTVIAYDMEKKAMRSFRIDKVTLMSI